VTLQTALALSINTVAAELANEVGPEGVVSTAHRLGITSQLQPNPSIALGTSEVSLLELTDAYVPFANNGYAVTPYVVTEIKSVGGKVLYERPKSKPTQVIDPVHVGMMNSMLKDTLERGTGRKAAIAGWPAAGKTGTTNDSRDAWFIGYTANLTAGVWLGNDDFRPTKRMTGGSLPAQIWNRFMVEAHHGVAVADLPGDYSFRDPERFDPGLVPPQPIGEPGAAGEDQTSRAGGLREVAPPKTGGLYDPDGDITGSIGQPRGPGLAEPDDPEASDGPVPPADVGPPPPDAPIYYEPPRRGGFLRRLFGG
jgi:penicillin-binding protein 1A